MTVLPPATSVCQTNDSTVDGPSVRRKPSAASRSCAQHGRGNRCVNSCCPDDLGASCPGAERQSGAVLASGAGRSGRSEFYIIARLDDDDSAADVYSKILDVPDGVHDKADWLSSLPVRPGTAADLDRLDHVLAAAGYQRRGGWRKRITASGAVRYFADATASSYVRMRTR